MYNGRKSNFGERESKKEYTEHRILEGSHIHKIQRIDNKIESKLYIIKFFDRTGDKLLDCGKYSDDFVENVELHINFRLKEITLEDNERLIGIRSNYELANHLNYGCHHSVQFIIGKLNNR